MITRSSLAQLQAASFAADAVLTAAWPAGDAGARDHCRLGNGCFEAPRAELIARKVSDASRPGVVQAGTSAAPLRQRR